jgi:mono/diheme cytochrome c family protein
MRKINYVVVAMLACLLVVACNNEPRAGRGAPSVELRELSRAAKGEAIFNSNCSSCHRKKEDATGPALYGVLGRWDNDTARLKNFIRNWGTVTASGKDPRANELAAKWNAMMTSFPNLMDRELDDLIAFIEE